MPRGDSETVTLSREEVAAAMIEKISQLRSMTMSPEKAGERYRRIFAGEIDLLDADEDVSNVLMIAALKLTPEQIQADVEVFEQKARMEQTMAARQKDIDKASTDLRDLQSRQMTLQAETFQSEWSRLQNILASGGRCLQDETMAIRDLKRTNPRIFGPVLMPVVPGRKGANAYAVPMG